jgi:ParB family chromosome partitioning protein
LRSLLGTRIQIRSSTRGGRIEIFYYSDDDLNRILELIYKAEG